VVSFRLFIKTDNAIFMEGGDAMVSHAGMLMKAESQHQGKCSSASGNEMWHWSRLLYMSCLDLWHLASRHASKV